MGRRVNKALHEAWRARIEQQEASGLTVAAFCEQAGITPNSFFQWRRRLRGASAQAVHSGSSEETACTLVPSAGPSVAHVTGRFVRIPMELESSASHLEVIFSDATRLRIPSQQLSAWELTLQMVMSRITRREAEARHV